MKTETTQAFHVGQRVVSLAVNYRGRAGVVTHVYDGVSRTVRIQYDSDLFSRDHAIEFLQDEAEYESALYAAQLR